MLNFGNKVEERNNDLMPKGALALCSLTVRGTKNSSQTNGRYLDVELVVLPNQPFAGRKMWDTIADAYDGQNSQEYRDMGIGKIRRILEAVKGARPDQPATYNLSSYEELSGLVVPVYVDIQKGKNGYEDKNIPDYLSPHSSVKTVVESYKLLQQGIFKHEKSAAKPAGQTPATGGFTPPAMQAAPVAATPAGQPMTAVQTNPQSAGPSWLAQDGGQQQQQAVQPAQTAAAAPAAAAPAQSGFIPPQQAATPAQSGFQQPQQAGQQVQSAQNAVAGQQPVTTAQVQPAMPAATSPSDTIPFPDVNQG